MKNVFERNDWKLSIEYCSTYDVIKRVPLVSVIDSSSITNTSFIFYCYTYGPTAQERAWKSGDEA